jgi:hypothetical protein
LTTRARGSRFWICSAAELPVRAARWPFLAGNETSATTVSFNSPSWRSVSSIASQGTVRITTSAPAAGNLTAVDGT